MKFQYPRDEHGDALCHHGRPIRCLECVADEEADDGHEVQAAGSPVADPHDGCHQRILHLELQLSEARTQVETLDAAYETQQLLMERKSEQLSEAQQEIERKELALQAASGFVRDVIEALGEPQPELDAVVDLPQIAMRVVGQIERFKVESEASERASLFLREEAERLKRIIVGEGLDPDMPIPPSRAKALMRYVQHAEYCTSLAKPPGVVTGGDYSCNCGLDALLSSASSEPTE